MVKQKLRDALQRSDVSLYSKDKEKVEAKIATLY